jgi:hypothetical protein
MQQVPEIAELSRNVLMERTPEGLNIQLVDQDGQSMFQPGSATLVPRARTLLQEVAKIVDRLPNRIAITGHTDGAQFVGPNGVTNWELSAARANAARAVLALERPGRHRIRPHLYRFRQGRHRSAAAGQSAGLLQPPRRDSPDARSAGGAAGPQTVTEHTYPLGVLSPSRP